MTLLTIGLLLGVASQLCAARFLGVRSAYVNFLNLNYDEYTLIKT